MNCAVLKQIPQVLVKHWSLLCHLTWCTHPQLAAVVRLCTQGHLCPGNIWIWGDTALLSRCLLSVMLAPSPGRSVCADTPWIPQCPWLTGNLVLRYQGHSCVVQTAACVLIEGRIYSLDSTLHQCDHMASGLQLVMEQTGNVEEVFVRL